jgi:hypothetical protein
MADVLIENPILNSPFHEPARHIEFTDEGITSEIVGGPTAKFLPPRMIFWRPDARRQDNRLLSAPEGDRERRPCDGLKCGFDPAWYHAAA